jgi:hypothetical protein
MQTREGIAKHDAPKIVQPQTTAWYACAVTPDPNINDSGLHIVASFGIDGVEPPSSTTIPWRSLVDSLSNILLGNCQLSEVDQCLATRFSGYICSRILMTGCHYTDRFFYFNSWNRFSGLVHSLSQSSIRWKTTTILLSLHRISPGSQQEGQSSDFRNWCLLVCCIQTSHSYVTSFTTRNSWHSKVTGYKLDNRSSISGWDRFLPFATRSRSVSVRSESPVQ